MVNVIIDTLWTILLFFYYFLEGIVLTLIPARYRRKNVNGETVLITGAGSGMGRLMSERFAELGCTVIVWDINKEANEETARICRNKGSSAYAYQVDLSNREKVYETANKVKADVGDIDILINNAGIVTGRKFLDSSDNLIQKTMEVNAMAHFWTVKAFLPSMMTRNHGHVVTIASVAGIIGSSGLCDYSASKFAAVGFDESLRFELAAQGKTGVHTTVVCPIYINTGMFTGVKFRFEWMLPLLDQNYVVDKIMDSVLTNTPIVYIPRIMYIFMAVKTLVPTKCGMLLGKFTGATQAMDGFEGHKKQ